MRISCLEGPGVVLVCAALLLTATASRAQTAPAEAGGEAGRLQQQLADQARQLEALQRAVAQQQDQLQRLLGQDQAPRPAAGSAESAAASAADRPRGCLWRGRR